MKRSKFAQRLFKNHVEVNAWPAWMRAAASSRRLFANSPEDAECTCKGCPCREAKQIMDEARARVTALVEAAS